MYSTAYCAVEHPSFCLCPSKYGRVTGVEERVERRYCAVQWCYCYCYSITTAAYSNITTPSAPPTSPRISTSPKASLPVRYTISGERAIPIQIQIPKEWRKRGSHMIYREGYEAGRKRDRQQWRGFCLIRSVLLDGLHCTVAGLAGGRWYGGGTVGRVGWIGKRLGEACWAGWAGWTVLYWAAAGCWNVGYLSHAHRYLGKGTVGWGK